MSGEERCPHQQLRTLTAGPPLQQWSQSRLQWGGLGKGPGIEWWEGLGRDVLELPCAHTEHCACNTTTMLKTESAPVPRGQVNGSWQTPRETSPGNRPLRSASCWCLLHATLQVTTALVLSAPCRMRAFVPGPSRPPRWPHPWLQRSAPACPVSRDCPSCFPRQAGVRRPAPPSPLGSPITHGVAGKKRKRAVSRGVHARPVTPHLCSWTH